MKLKTFLIVGCLGGFFALNSCTAPTNEKDYSVFVNPFIGTGGHGHTFPGAVVPHGMIQPSPDTRIDGWDACSGYYYEDSTINGFSHTHVSGTGCCDYGDVLLMPTVGEQRYQTTDPQSQQLAYSSAFSHENETAEPGYYSVFLDTYQVKAEISATKRGAIHRYTFPESSEAGFILDLDYSLQRQTNSDMGIEVISDTEICGHKKTTYWAFDQYINFYAKFSKPFAYTLITDSVTMDNGKRLPVCKAVLHFNTKKDEEVLVKVGVSAVDIAGARKNVESEIPEWDFDKVRKDARTAWNNYLSKIDITTSDKEDKTIFYTALYHTAISPNLFTDADGRYLGMDLEVHQGDTINPLYTVFSLWDTFRASHPLYTLLEPERVTDFVKSMIRQYEYYGYLPIWQLWGQDNYCMIGNHSIPVITDAILKGIPGIDMEKAYEAVYNSSVTSHPNSPFEVWEKYGFMPENIQTQSVSITLEQAFDDWCVAQLAAKLNKDADYQRFHKRSEYYRNLFHPKTKFFQSKNDKGEWIEPFDPYQYGGNGGHPFTEGNAWQYFWYVPHNIQALMELTGGTKAFEQKLDTFFTSTYKSEQMNHNASGFVGQYAHGNEPSHHVTYLYALAGRPERTQELIREIFDTQYKNKPDGLCGNDDCGQMSAWYMFSAMGFYPVDPVSGDYVFGAPQLPKIVLHLADGKTFTVIAENLSKEHKYVDSITLNGEPYTKNTISHEDILKGGTLVYKMK